MHAIGNGPVFGGEIGAGFDSIQNLLVFGIKLALFFGLLLGFGQLFRGVFLGRSQRRLRNRLL